MTDEQLIQRLRNASTDAVLSGDHVKALWLSQAAARLTELSIIHHTWHLCYTTMVALLIGKETATKNR